MKRWLIYLLVGLGAFAGVGGGTILTMSLSNPPVELPSEEDPDDGILTEEEETPKDRFMANLMSGNLRIDNLNADINTGTEDINVNFIGAITYDAESLMKGDFSALKASGDLNLKVTGFDETLSFTFPGNNTLFFSYYDFDYSVSVDSLTSIFDLIPLFTQEQIIPDANNLNQEEVLKASSIDLDGLLENIPEYLNNIVQEDTADGYKFLLTIPEFDTTIILHSNMEELLTGIELSSPISIEGITIDLDAQVTASKTESFVEGPDGNYQPLDEITSIVSTLKNVLNDKKFTADLNLKAKSLNDNALDLDLYARLSADITNVAQDFLKGVYDISILPQGVLQGNPQLNSIDLHYEAENIFFHINELLNGKLQNQTIEDIIEIVTKELGSSESQDQASNMINDIFGGSILLDLINGDISKIKGAISSLTSNNNGFKVDFTKEFLNSETPFSIVINTDKGEIKNIKIIGLTLEGIQLDLVLEIKKYAGSAAIFEDLTIFKDYSEGISIYNTISDLLNTKTFSADFDIDIMHKDEIFSFDGMLGADLSAVDFNDTNTLLNGTYRLSANVTNQDVIKKVDAAMQDQKLYINYNDLIVNSIANATLMDFIDFISEKLGSSNTTETEFDLNKIFEFLGINLAEYEQIIDEVTKFNLTALDDFVKIDENNKDPNKLIVQVLPDSSSDDYLILELNTANESLSTISLRNVTIGEATLNLTLTLTEEDFRLTNTEIYKPLDSLLGNVEKLMNSKNFNLSLDASVVDSDTTVDPITVGANVQVDLDTTEFYGKLDLSAKLPIDANVYNHHLYLDNYSLGDNLGNELLLKYYGNENSAKPMRIAVNNDEFGSILDTILNIPEDNSLLFIFKTMTGITLDMPLMDIINGDYSLLFNDYIKKFETTDTALNLSLSGALFGIDSNISLSLTYDDSGFKSLSIIDLKLGSKTINVTLSLNDYDENLKSNRLHITEPKANNVYINGNYLDLFLQVGINTTQSRMFWLAGQFNMSFTSSIVELIQKPIYMAIDMKLQILEPDGSVNAVITLTTTDSNGNAINPSNAGYRQTKFYILENNDCIVRQYRITEEGFISKTKYSEIETFKVTQSEFASNIHYYLFKYALNLSDTIFNPINDAIMNPSTDSSGTTDLLNFKYENIISSMDYNEAGKSFNMTVDLNSIVNLEGVTSGFVTQDSISISLLHDSNNILSSLHIYGTPISVKVSIGSWDMISIGVNLDVLVYNRTSEGFTMDDFNEFTTWFKNDSVMSILPYYYYREGNNGAIHLTKTQIS